MKIGDFEWDEWNSQHIELGHGILPAEAEEVFIVRPLFRKTKKGHYVVMGPAGGAGGWHMTIVFEMKEGGIARVITGWDMDDSEKRYYSRSKKG